MPPPAAPPARPRRPWRRLLASLFGLLILDGLLHLTLIRDGEFLGHPVPPFGALTHAGQAEWLQSIAGPDETGMGRFDRELGWTWNRPAASDDGQITVSEQGARGERLYAQSPPAGTTRMLFFGDSFTFCEEISDPNSFEAILERDHPELEAINFGVSGFGTDQAYLRYRRLAKDWKTHGVGIGILLENIGRNVNRYRPLWNLRTSFCGVKPRFVLDAAGELTLLPHPIRDRPMLRDTILDGSILGRVAEHEHWLDVPDLGPWRWSSLARIGGGLVAQLERSPARLWNRPEREPFQVTLAILESFHREALANGAEFAPLIVFASREDVLEHALVGKPYWDAFYSELERRGLPFIDTADALAARHREIQETGEHASLFYGGHLSGVGNAVVAGEIHAYLTEHGHLDR